MMMVAQHCECTRCTEFAEQYDLNGELYFFLLYFYKTSIQNPSTFEMEQNFQDFFILEKKTFSLDVN